MGWNGLFTIFVLIARAFLFLIDLVQAMFEKSGAGKIITLIFRLMFDLFIFGFMFLMNAVIAINSRKNEYRADRYAYELGYGEELVEAFYLLEKINLGDNSTVIQKMLKSHPRITARIERVEALLDGEEAIQTDPWPLS
ncbi:MAG: M48 family metalloprotease [Oscillospiraceae bacterium]|nr:M48 family metalloprotease [Oscillospiraceae bacterium]